MSATVLRLKGGHGYWQTDYYPVGGCFRRAGKDGKQIAEVLKTFPSFKGVDTEVRFTDGTRGAVAGSAIERQGGAE